MATFRCAEWRVTRRLPSSATRGAAARTPRWLSRAALQARCPHVDSCESPCWTDKVIPRGPRGSAGRSGGATLCLTGCEDGECRTRRRLREGDMTINKECWSLLFSRVSKGHTRVIIFLKRCILESLLIAFYCGEKGITFGRIKIIHFFLRTFVHRTHPDNRKDNCYVATRDTPCKPAEAPNTHTPLISTTDSSQTQSHQPAQDFDLFLIHQICTKDQGQIKILHK